MMRLNERGMGDIYALIVMIGILISFAVASILLVNTPSMDRYIHLFNLMSFFLGVVYAVMGIKLKMRIMTGFGILLIISAGVDNKAIPPWTEAKVQLFLALGGAFFQPKR